MCFLVDLFFLIESFFLIDFLHEASPYLIKTNNNLPKKEVQIENEFTLPGNIFEENE